MLLVFLVLLGQVYAQQELCYEGPGNIYSGSVNVTAGGAPCESWAEQSLISLDKPVDHNYCRVYLQMSSRPYCVYRGQKQSCDISTCDKSTLRFQGSGFALSRDSNEVERNFPIVVQRIDFYFKVDELRRSEAVLVRVQSLKDPRQHMSVILQNGFLKLIISLDSYNAEKFVFGGPVRTSEVHYISVNRSRANIFVTLNDTVSNYTLANRETTFLVSPYSVTVGENFWGCMTGLSVGTWLQLDTKSPPSLRTDKPLMLFTGEDIDDFTLRLAKLGTPYKEMCMFAPTTSITRTTPVLYSVEEASIENSVEASIERKSLKGALDQRSIIIISVAIGVIVSLSVMTLICVRKNQDYTPQGYNLEVM